MLKIFEDEVLVANAKGSRRPQANPPHQEQSAPKVKSQSRSRSKSKERGSSSNLRLRSGGPSKPTFNVRIAEQSEQYQDMIEILKPLYLSEDKNSKESISVEERNLLSVAYKNAVGLKRIAWRAAKKALST